MTDLRGALESDLERPSLVGAEAAVEPILADVPDEPVYRRRRRISRDLPAVIGLTVIALIALMALTAPLLAPHSPTEQDLRARLQPPIFLGGSMAHLLGTDKVGRDILSRVMHGSQVTLVIGVLGVVVGGIVGVTAGLLAGFLGGRVDLVLGRLADIQQAVPFVILVLAIVAVLGTSLSNLILVLGLGSWLFYFRVVRGEVLVVRDQPYVEASRVIGAGRWRIIRRRILPNVAPSIIVVVTLFVPQVIIFTAGLSFLGLGVPPTTPEWGSMIADGTQYLREAPWLSLGPAAFLVITVLSVNLVGDWLRDVLDPVQRRRA
jgi:peptide/nickel transport system permease protein